ncbi:Pseudouridine synthase OS=Castellaniella defragrans OX=75697 GN=HNR28_003020 PE=3 SV=1 [Castellaniella defragrans]
MHSWRLYAEQFLASTGCCDYMTLSPVRKVVVPPAPSPAVRHVTITAGQADQRLDNFLLRVCKGVPKSHIYKAIRDGQVRVNRGRCRAETRLAMGDQVRIPPLRMPDPAARPPAPPAAFPVLYEDNHLLVIDKPAGVAVHGGSGVSYGVIEQLRSARPDDRMLELAHRLDRETSGVLMVARSRKALVALHDMMRAHAGRKRYLALVVGDWVNDRQHVRLPLLKYLTPSGERRVRVDADGKPAHTIVTLRYRYGGAWSLLEAELRTGRTHQIRVHLAAQGHPVAGDEKYGSDAVRAALFARNFRRMFLHAFSLEIPHPVTGEPLVLEAPLPPDCEKLLEALKQETLK